MSGVAVVVLTARSRVCKIVFVSMADVTTSHQQNGNGPKDPNVLTQQSHSPR